MLTPPRAAFYYAIAVPLTVSPTLLLFVRILVCVFPLKAPQICAAVDVTIHVLRFKPLNSYSTIISWLRFPLNWPVHQS